MLKEEKKDKTRYTVLVLSLNAHFNQTPVKQGTITVQTETRICMKDCTVIMVAERDNLS